MGKKTKAARKLWFQRNSRVLTRKIRINVHNAYTFVSNISKTQKNVEKALSSHEADGKQGIHFTIKNLLIETKKTMDYLYHIFIYINVIEKRMLKNINKVFKELQEITELIKNYSQLLTDSGADLQSLYKQMNNTKDLYEKLKNNIRTQKLMARDLKRDHQRKKEKDYFETLLGEFHDIKRAARNLKREIKIEKKDERKIKQEPQELEKLLKKISKEKNKKDLKEIKKIIGDITKELKIEIPTLSDETDNLLIIDKKSIILYFDVTNSKEYIREILTSLQQFYDKKKFEELEKEYMEIEEIEKEHTQFDYYIEKWMKGELEDSKLDEVSDNARVISKLERHPEKSKIK